MLDLQQQDHPDDSPASPAPGPTKADRIASAILVGILYAVLAASIAWLREAGPVGLVAAGLAGALVGGALGSWKPLFAAGSRESRAFGQPPDRIALARFATSSSSLSASSCLRPGMRTMHSSRPEYRSTHLYKAVLILLLAVLYWARRLSREGLALKPTRGADPLAAFFPLLVVVGFGCDQLAEANRRAAQKELASKKHAWHQAVDEQRERSRRASEQVTAAIVKQGEAFKLAMKSGQAVKAADGGPGFRVTPEVARKLEEARKDLDRAFERDKAERDRLQQLLSEFWHYR